MTPEAAPDPADRRLCRVRPAARADAETITAFNCELARESEGLALDPAVVATGVQAVFDDPGRGVYYVAEIDGRPVGQVMTTQEWTDWRNGWFWWIQSVYVEPHSRRRGVFRALYRHVTSLARERGDVRGLRLYVVQTNARAIDTYVRLGMARTEYLFYETDLT